MRIFISIVICLNAMSSLGATLPQVHNGSIAPPALPTRVLECNIPIFPLPTTNITNFANCLESNVTGYANEVAGEASASLNATITSLQNEINTLLPLEITTCLANLNTSVVSSVNAATSNPANFAANRMQAVSNIVMGNAQNIFNVSLEAPESQQQLVQRYRQALLEAFNDDPVGSCLATLSPQTLNQLTNVALGQAQQMRAQLEDIFQVHFRPRIDQLVNNKLGPAFKELSGRGRIVSSQAGRLTGKVVKGVAPVIPVPEEIELIAQGLLLERTLDPARLNVLAALLKQYAVARSPSTQDRQKLLSRLANAQTVTDGVAIDLGIRVLRYYGHDVIDDAGEPLVGLSIEYLRGFKTVIFEVVDVPCATGVYVSSGVCSLVQGMAGIAVDFASWGLKKATLEAMHESFDLMVDSHRQYIVANAPSVAQAQQSSWLRPIAQHLPTEDELIGLMMPRLRAHATSMAAYHAAVASLVNAHLRVQAGRDLRATSKTNRKPTTTR